MQLGYIRSEEPYEFHVNENSYYMLVIRRVTQCTPIPTHPNNFDMHGV